MINKKTFDKITKNGLYIKIETRGFNNQLYCFTIGKSKEWTTSFSINSNDIKHSAFNKHINGYLDEVILNGGNDE
jgi:hypothetical protein